jgi:predicted metal-dependent hydrolase
MPTREAAARDACALALGGERVEYVLVRRRGRRGVGLKVDGHGLTVSAPVTMPQPRVEALVRDSERWVLKKIAEWKAKRVPVVAWREGAALPWLGGDLVLRLAEGAPRVEAADGELRVRVRALDEAAIRRAVVGWYKRAARDYLGKRLLVLSHAARMVPPRFLLSSALARWGSCNSKREVRLTWRLAKAPPALVDYVICHELAHLRHMNHSAAFWAEVERQCPDYRRLRAELFATDHLYRAF